MDYTMVQMGIWPNLKGSNISKTEKAVPTKISVHAFDINPYLHEFFELILFDSIFSLPWTIVHGPKGNLATFESSNISKTEEVTPTKIGVRAFDINPYLQEFFEPILFNSIFLLPWVYLLEMELLLCYFIRFEFS